MPQTILALFAIVLASTFSLTQQRHRALTARTVLSLESDLSAAEIGDEFLDAISSLPFDAATSVERSYDSSLLTGLPLLADAPALRFEGVAEEPVVLGDAGFISQGSDGHPVLGGAGSITALHNAHFELSRPAEHGHRRFRLDAAVGYVSEADESTPTTTPTKVRIVSVRITSLDAGDTGNVYLSRIYTCGDDCGW